MSRRLERHKHILIKTADWYPKPLVEAVVGINNAWNRWMLTIPSFATGPVWDRIDHYQRTNWPLRYWLQKDVPMWFRIKKRQLGDARRWVERRITRRYNLIRVPSLKPGYYDTDTMMFHSNFDLLKDHVERGLAYRGWDKDEDTRLKNWPKFLRERFLNKPPPGSGMNYLNWVINDPDLKIQAPSQAEWAAEVRDLYLWWTVERPARIEPYEDPRIWSAEKLQEKKTRKRGRGRRPLFDRDNDRKERDHAMRANEFYEEQDQQMFLRLSAIRRYLWS